MPISRAPRDGNGREPNNIYKRGKQCLLPGCDIVPASASRPSSSPRRVAVASRGLLPGTRTTVLLTSIVPRLVTKVRNTRNRSQIPHYNRAALPMILFLRTSR